MMTMMMTMMGLMLNLKLYHYQEFSVQYTCNPSGVILRSPLTSNFLRLVDVLKILQTKLQITDNLVNSSKQQFTTSQQQQQQQQQQKADSETAN